MPHHWISITYFKAGKIVIKINDLSITSGALAGDFRQASAWLFPAEVVTTKPASTKYFTILFSTFEYGPPSDMDTTAGCIPFTAIHSKPVFKMFSIE